MVGYDFSLSLGKFLIASDFCDVGFPEITAIREHRGKVIDDGITCCKWELERKKIQEGAAQRAHWEKSRECWLKRKRYMTRNLDNGRKDFFAQLAARLTKTYDVIVLENIGVLENVLSFAGRAAPEDEGQGYRPIRQSAGAGWIQKWLSDYLGEPISGFFLRRYAAAVIKKNTAKRRGNLHE